jgi:hypothetical protein
MQAVIQKANFGGQFLWKQLFKKMLEDGAGYDSNRLGIRRHTEVPF